jgi:hypothetical protein
MPTAEWTLGHTQSLINRAIELVRECEELVQDTKATRSRLNHSRQKVSAQLQERVRACRAINTL